MSYSIACDRCGTIKLLGHHNPTHVPSGWGIVDGYQLCDNCDAAYHAFLRGEAVPTAKAPATINVGFCDSHPSAHPLMHGCTNWHQAGTGVRQGKQTNDPPRI
jgi:hypothetical protein